MKAQSLEQLQIIPSNQPIKKNNSVFIPYFNERDKLGHLIVNNKEKTSKKKSFMTLSKQSQYPSIGSNLKSDRDHDRINHYKNKINYAIRQQKLILPRMFHSESPSNQIKTETHLEYNKYNIREMSNKNFYTHMRSLNKVKKLEYQEELEKFISFLKHNQNHLLQKDVHYGKYFQLKMVNNDLDKNFNSKKKSHMKHTE